MTQHTMISGITHVVWCKVGSLAVLLPVSGGVENALHEPVGCNCALQK